MGKEITEAELVSYYGPEKAIQFGSGDRVVNTTLGAVLQAEALCPADSHKRLDPSLRVAYLAGALLAAGSLDAEHVHLLLPPKEQG